MIILKKFFTISLFAFIFHLSVESQIPTNYYSGTETINGQELKTALFYIIKDHNALSYADLWSAFYDTDRKPNGKVWDMYSDKPGQTPPYEYTFFSDQCGNYNSENDCYNREHSFPKSWFNDGYPMYTDMFHLVPTDGYVNGKRSNYPYGRVGTATWTSLNGSKLGNSNFPGYTGVVFEPIDAYKGDFARAYFYMVTRYQDKVSNWNSAMLNHTSYPAFTSWALDLLMQWHEQDPVSQKEIDRNNAIYYDYQGNRNPFIDNPTFAQRIWGTLDEILIFSSQPILSAVPGNLYSYSITTQLTSKNKSAINITCEEQPAWLTFESTGNGTALLHGTPEISDIGISDVILKATYLEQTVYQSFSIEVTETEINYPPVFGDIYFTPTAPHDYESVTVYAEITDPNADPIEAELKWGTSSTVLNNTLLMTKSEDIFSATIPPNSNGTTVYFKIIASDDNDGESQSSIYNYAVTTTAIEEHQNCISSIYAHSSNNNRTISIYNNCFAIHNVKLYSLAGQLLYIKEVEGYNNPTVIEIPTLKTGLYFLKINNNTYTKTIKILIK